MSNFTPLAVKDNAEAQLNASISASSLSIPVQAGQGSLFPETKNGTCDSAGDNNTLNATGFVALGGAVGDAVYNITQGVSARIVSQSTNQAITTALPTGISWDDTDEFVISDGESYGPFVLTMTKRSGGVSTGTVTQMEKVLITERTIDTLKCKLANRGFGGTTPATFDADDFVSVFWTQHGAKELFDEIGNVQLELLEKPNTGDVILESVGTAKGDLISFSAAGVTEIVPIGTDGFQLIADSSEPSGMKWVIIGAGETEFLDSAFAVINSAELATDPTVAPTAVIGGSAGDLENGDHDYKYSFVTSTGETLLSPISAVVTIVDKTILGRINLTVPVSSDPGVTARRIYRRFNQTGDYKYVDEIADNVTTAHVDNRSNADLLSVFSSSFSRSQTAAAPLAAGTYDVFAIYTDGSTSSANPKEDKTRAVALPTLNASGSHFYTYATVDETSNAPSGATHKFVVVKRTDDGELRMAPLTVSSTAGFDIAGNSPTLTLDQWNNLVGPLSAPVANTTEKKLTLDLSDLTQNSEVKAPDVSSGTMLVGGTVATETVTPTKSTTVVIDGVEYKIALEQV